MAINPIQLVKAIKLLKPTAEFVIKENDYSSIEWHILEGNAPTTAEIEAALEKVKTQEAQAELDKAAAKAAAEAKLTALGLTADDLKALGLA
jgi:hypothetical protein